MKYQDAIGQCYTLPVVCSYNVVKVDVKLSTWSVKVVTYTFMGSVSCVVELKSN